MADTTKKIAELEELEKKATPGPWSERGLHYLLRHGSKNDGSWAEEVALNEYLPDGNDSALIVAMRNALPGLISAYKNMAACAGLRGARIGCLEDDLENANVRAEKAEKELAEYNVTCSCCQDIAGQSAADWKARAEKAEKALFMDREILSGELGELKERAEKAEAARDVLAERLERHGCPDTTKDCDKVTCEECWAAWAAQEAAKRVAEEVAE